MPLNIQAALAHPFQDLPLGPPTSDIKEVKDLYFNIENALKIICASKIKVSYSSLHKTDPKCKKGEDFVVNKSEERTCKNDDATYNQPEKLLTCNITKEVGGHSSGKVKKKSKKKKCAQPPDEGGEDYPPDDEDDDQDKPDDKEEDDSVGGGIYFTHIDIEQNKVWFSVNFPGSITYQSQKGKKQKGKAKAKCIVFGKDVPAGIISDVEEDQTVDETFICTSSGMKSQLTNP